MTSTKDIIHQWLGIPPEQQPPNCFQWLGVADGERDREVVRNAAERQCMHVRRLARGEHLEIGQKILNKIGQAKLEVLDSSNAANTPLPQNRRPSAYPDAPFSITPPRGTRIDAAGIPIGIRQSIVLGYRDDCDARVDHATVSGVHCRITRLETDCLVADLNSTNGTFLNGQRISRARLGAEDLLVLGGDHRVILPPHFFNGERSASRVHFFVGRDAGNEVVVDIDGVRPYHAKVVIDDDLVWVEPLTKTGVLSRIRAGLARPVKNRTYIRRHDILEIGKAHIKVGNLIDRLRNELLHRVSRA
ncbi:MAG: FHA domain-containing protein [Planctomycetota bacterium]